MGRSIDASELGRRIRQGDRLALARLLSLIESGDRAALECAFEIPVADDAQVVGFTGAPGVGKSTLIDAVVASLRSEGARVGVLAVDPSSPCSGGALLGDRVRMMRHVGDCDVFIRSLANRGHLGGLAAALPAVVHTVAACGFSTLLIETVGVGQAEVDIARHADTTVVVVTPGMGDAVQTSKAGILEIADVLIVNKSDRGGVREAVRDLRDMLHLKPRSPGGWQVPVLVTRADTGDEVGDVVLALREHRDHVAATGELRRAHNARAIAAFESYAVVRLFDWLEKVLDSQHGRDLMERVGTGESSPVTAADELLVNVRASSV